MKTRLISFNIVLCALLSVVTLFSCSYDDYADADYPASEIYQSQANDVLHIDATADVSTGETPTKGAPLLYEIDKQNQKLVIHLGVVQSGIQFSSGIVNLAIDNAAVDSSRTEGTLSAGVETLSPSYINIPDMVNITNDSAPFNVEINLATINEADNAGKQLAFAVKISSSDIKVNEKLATQLVVIDVDFIKSQLL